MKLYFKTVLLFVVSILLFGVAAPFLISAPSTELFIAGIVLLIIGIPLVTWLAKSTIVELFDKLTTFLSTHID